MWSVSTPIVIAFRGTGVGTFSLTQLRLPPCRLSFVNFPTGHNSVVLCDWSLGGSFFIDTPLPIYPCLWWRPSLVPVILIPMPKETPWKIQVHFYSALPWLWSWWRLNPGSQHCYMGQRTLSFYSYNCSFAHETLRTWRITYVLMQAFTYIVSRTSNSRIT